MTDDGQRFIIWGESEHPKHPAATKPVQLTTDPLHDFSQLMCPGCEDTYLHQRNAAVLWREEDKPGTLYQSSPSGAQTTSEVTPAAGRRDSLAIMFECENCGDEYYLEIRQHKGQTYLMWHAANPFEDARR